MNRRLIIPLGFLSVAFIGMIGDMLIGKARSNTPDSGELKADTVRIVIHDTLTIPQPAPATVAQLPDVVRRLPRWRKPAGIPADTTDSMAADSADVIVPMERKEYTDSSTYRAVISGAWVALDTIEIYPRREIVTIKQPPDRRRWGVSLVAGYGWAGKWTPFVGVGVSYNLFRF